MHHVVVGLNMLEVTHSIKIPLEEFEFTYARSSGPGGQNVNKVNSKALLRWRITESPSLAHDVRERFLAKFKTRVTLDGDLLITSQKTRDQISNHDDCLEKLSEMLKSVAIPPKTRRPTKPSKGSKKRRLADKKVQGAKKQGRRGGGWEE